MSKQTERGRVCHDPIAKLDSSILQDGSYTNKEIGEINKRASLYLTDPYFHVSSGRPVAVQRGHEANAAIPLFKRR